jgi:hypothetical protein
MAELLLLCARVLQLVSIEVRDAEVFGTADCLAYQKYNPTLEEIVKGAPEGKFI